MTKRKNHVTHGGGWAFFQNFSSPALTAWHRQCLEDILTKHDQLNEWINYEGGYRTALAKPGLLISKKKKEKSHSFMVLKHEYFWHMTKTNLFIYFYFCFSTHFHLISHFVGWVYKLWCPCVCLFCPVSPPGEARGNP